MEQHNPAFEKIPLSVTNPFSENLRRLAALFPSVIKDGQVDLDALKEELGEFEEVDKEHYELSWAGKQEAKRTAGEPVIGRTLKYVPEESKDPESTENLYIEGDNLEVLKLLQNAYIGKIKMIYIDPPYNTGNDFVYRDHFAVTAEENAKAEGDVSAEGERYAVNPKTSGKYHANWLSMMYPRLRLAKNLLSEDGVIFISIDDNEIENLKNICNEMFGESNFVANIVWKHTQQSKNDEPHFSRQYNHTICYAKNKMTLKNFYFERTEEDDKNYSNPDNDTKGMWRSGDVRSPNYRKTLCYDITAPNGNKITPPANGWRWSEESLKEKIATGEIKFKKDNSGIIRKIYLCDQPGRTPENLWEGRRFGTTRQAAAMIKELFDGIQVFDTPKPMELIMSMLSIAVEKDSIILDFFSGSSTTAHAVMQLNAEDGGNRKFIMVQLPEECPPDSEAYKAGYKTICEIGKERIRRAGEKIRKEHPEASPDTGFNVFRLADTNIRWIAAETGQVSLEDAIITSGKDLRDFMPGYTDKDVVYEILLRQYDIPLTAKIESLGEIGKRTYSVAGTLIVCLEESITNEIIERIANIEPVPHKIIFRDSAFGDDISLKENTMMRLDALMQKHSSGGKTPYRVEFL